MLVLMDPANPRSESSRSGNRAADRGRTHHPGLIGRWTCRWLDQSPAATCLERSRPITCPGGAPFASEDPISFQDEIALATVCERSLLSTGRNPSAVNSNKAGWRERLLQLGSCSRIGLWLGNGRWCLVRFRSLFLGQFSSFAVALAGPLADERNHHWAGVIISTPSTFMKHVNQGVQRQNSTPARLPARLLTMPPAHHGRPWLTLHRLVTEAWSRAAQGDDQGYRGRPKQTSLPAHVRCWPS